MSYPPLLNQHTLPATIGSYWRQNVDEPSLNIVRQHCHMSSVWNGTPQIIAMLSELTASQRVQLKCWSIRFDTRRVGTLGPDLQARIQVTLGTGTAPIIVTRRPMVEDLGALGNFAMVDESLDSINFQLEAGGCGYVLFPDPSSTATGFIDPNMLRTRYFVSVPFDMVPSSIILGEREMLLGIDFTLGFGVMIFNEAPEKLFPDNIIVMRGVRRDVSNVFNFTFKADEFYGSGEAIARYQRESNSALRLKEALVVLSGLSAMPFDGVVLKRLDLDMGARYLFEEGVIEARYRHDPLVVGQELKKGDIIGDGLKVRGPAGAGWYREFDWQEQPLILGALSPVPNVIILDQMCQAQAYEQTGSKLHVRVNLGMANSDEEDRFWAHVKAAEIASGYYLNDVIGLTVLDEIIHINPLNTWFDYLLSSRSVIVELRLRQVGEVFRQRILKFLDEERAVGSILILRDL